MKKIKIYLQATIALALFFTVSCQKENIMKYESDDSVYFYNTIDNDIFTDSTMYSFMDHGSATKDTLTIRIKLIGKLSDKDRSVNVAIDSTTATNGTDFKLITPVVLQKDSGYASVKIVLFRTTSIKTDKKTIWVGLHNSDDINVANYPGYTSFKIMFSDKLEKPMWWDNYLGYMWEYSETRFLFYLSVMGSSTNFFAEDYNGTLFKLKVALAEYNATHSTPLADEFGLISWDVSWVDK